MLIYQYFIIDAVSIHVNLFVEVMQIPSARLVVSVICKYFCRSPLIGFTLMTLQIPSHFVALLSYFSIIDSIYCFYSSKNILCTLTKLRAIILASSKQCSQIQNWDIFSTEKLFQLFSLQPRLLKISNTESYNSSINERDRTTEADYVISFYKIDGYEKVLTCGRPCKIIRNFNCLLL